MTVAMAIRQPPKVNTPIVERTEFQLYTEAEGLHDFTARRLANLLLTTRTPKRRAQLAELLDAYKKESVAVAWQRGEPLYIRVTKENTGKPSNIEDLG